VFALHFEPLSLVPGVQLTRTMRPLFLLFTFVSLLPAQSQAILTALSTGTYFPLDVGYRLVYREDTRFQTATYQTWRVDRTEAVNGNPYSVIAIEGPYNFYGGSWFRADPSGRIWHFTGAGDRLFLDPSLTAPNSSQLQLTGPSGSYPIALGTFPDTVPYLNNVDELDTERGVLARGIGLLTSTTALNTGSSGGDTMIRTLVEADIAGGLHFPALTSAVDLGMESLYLDVTGKKVTNCAIPCYFAACGIAGADPAGTYKPCAQARVALRHWPATQSRTVTLQLLSPDGSSAYSSIFAVDSSSADSVSFLQVPLYSAPNQPLAPGVYQLSAATADGSAQASLKVTIQ
jgi:hypothetical protein